MMNFYSNTEGSLDLKRSYVFTLLTVLTLGRTRKFIPSPWYRVGRGEGGGGGGGWNPSPEFFYMLQYFGTILLSMGSL